jgi:rhodanese-related sulfurtransferase
MLKKSLILLLSLVIFVFVACDKDDSTSPSDKVNEFELLTELGDAYFGTYVNVAGNSPNTSIAALFPILGDGDATNDPFIIDMRSAEDYAAGHITGAVNIGLSSLMDKVEDGTIPADKPIVNICYTGQTASYATALLNLMGYEAQNLLFGMCGVDTSLPKAGTWLSQIAEDEFADAMVADETVATETYDFVTIETGASDGLSVLKARAKEAIPMGWSVSAADVFASPDDYFVINYWPMAEYIDPGHIPGAVCFEPKGAFKSDGMLNNLPTGTDKTIVVYCYTGQTSAQVTAYLQCLGYNAKSLLFGFNGMAYNKLSKSKYAAPTDDYSSIIVK